MWGKEKGWRARRDRDTGEGRQRDRDGSVMGEVDCDALSDSEIRATQYIFCPAQICPALRGGRRFEGREKFVFSGSKNLQYVSTASRAKLFSYPTCNVLKTSKCAAIACSSGSYSSCLNNKRAVMCMCCW